jgi:hypothetical protein
MSWRDVIPPQHPSFPPPGKPILRKKQKKEKILEKPGKSNRDNMMRIIALHPRWSHIRGCSRNSAGSLCARKFSVQSYSHSKYFHLPHSPPSLLGGFVLRNIIKKCNATP